MSESPDALVITGPSREGFGTRLDEASALSFVEVSTPSEAPSHLREHSVDCLVVGLPAPDGLDVIEDVASTFPSLSIVLAPSDGSEKLATDAFAAGVDDYLPSSLLETAEIASRIEAAIDAPDAPDRAKLEQYRTIINAIPDPVYATNADGMFTYVNDAMESLIGYDLDPEDNEGIFLGMTPEDLETSREIVRELLSSKTDKEKDMFEMDLVTRDGRTIDVENHITLLPYDEEFRGTAGVLRDITGQKRRKRRLDVLDTILRHNLRNDMNVITSYAEIVEESATDPDHVTAASKIKSKARELIRISDEIRNLQDVIRAKQTDGSLGRVDAVELVDDVVTVFREEYPYASIRVTGPDEALVSADETLRRALHDLVENALEHSDREEPEVTVSVDTNCTPPQSAAKDDAVTSNWVAMQVADDGPGIPEYERELITGNENITPLQHGSGLGLWIVSWITESFGGIVTITDNEPRGSVVTIRLPQPADR